LTSHGITPNRLQIEITGEVLLSNSQIVRANLAQLRSIGVRLALDDFGTGYASIANSLEDTVLMFGVAPWLTVPRKSPFGFRRSSTLYEASALPKTGGGASGGGLLFSGRL
jgi:hypothetical protein